ncbi:MAG: F0F1 ATP synthase subunit delta, partial [Candidatus Celaenobacter polaris]|nr:F0F1 ATP synthase subunit delta [Candidatus Celaenobacter polaris]
DILKEIIRQIHQKLGIFDFELVTAHEVDEKTLENIKNFISKYVDGKVLFQHKIDPHIRGGFFAYNDNLAINASVRNNLEAMRRKF